MKKLISYFFVFFFVAQLLYFCRQPDSAIVFDENRKIHEFPQKVRFTAKGLRQFFSKFDAFLSDRIIMRQEVLRVSRKVSIIDNNVLSGAYVGKDDWLFLGNPSKDTVGKLMGVVSEAVQKRSAKYVQSVITKVHNETLQNNIIVFVGPNKSTIYPEYLPDLLQPSPKRYAQTYFEEIQKAGLKFFDPTEILRASKERGPLYYRADSHWNVLGCATAYEAFLMYANTQFDTVSLRVPPFSLETQTATKDDLVKMLTVSYQTSRSGDSFALRWADERRDLEMRDSEGQASIISPVAALNTPLPGKPLTVINSESETGLKLWLFRDSFSADLSPFFHATFAETRHFNYVDFFNVDFSGNERPDLIIFENVERQF